MPTKQDYMNVIQRKLSAESEENQEKTSVSSTGSSMEMASSDVSTKEEYD
jgi:hypothetical protein